MLLTTMVFMMVSLIIIFGLTTPIIKQLLVSRDIWSAKQSYYLSEAGAEDVMYRLKDSNFSSKLSDAVPEILIIDGYQAVTEISGDIYSGRTIITQSNQDGYKKTIETSVIQGAGTSFNYGILTGEGGFVLTGGSSVVGNIYSNGNIFGGSGVHITGSAIAASAGEIFKDETNETPTTPPNGIVFNNTKDTSRDFAQSFQPGTTSAVQRISIYIKKTNSPGNFVVNLMSNSSGNPGSVLTTGTLLANQVTTNYGWVDLTFAQNITLTKDTTYWLVIQGTANNNSSDTYTIAANNTYSKGMAKVGKVGSTWYNTNPTGLDGYFSVYLGSTPSRIFGNEGDYFYIGSSSTDIAWAYDVSHVSMTGSLRCKIGTNNANGKVCNTSYDIPDTLPMPVSQANIDQWKAEAVAGGAPYNGNFVVDWDGDILGPRKITGNLTVNGGGTLLVTGTLWVQGYIIVTGGGKIKLSPSLGGNSVIILSDKYVQVDGGGQFEGSGTVGSYPVIVSTSICPNTTPCSNGSAVSLSGGAGAVVLNAPFGKVSINGGSGARSVSGNSIYISGGGSVTYETGLANLSFTSGPSGGWEISGWGETY